MSRGASIGLLAALVGCPTSSVERPETPSLYLMVSGTTVPGALILLEAVAVVPD